MVELRQIVPAFVFVWAGVALGGNLVAAPAKFQVSTLTLAELLQVGRSQFAWIGGVEMVLAAMVVTMLLFSGARANWPLLVAESVFLLQQIALQPLLQDRSDIIISGGPSSGSHLHILFVAAEIIKFGLLVVSACQFSFAPHRSWKRQPT